MVVLPTSVLPPANPKHNHNALRLSIGIHLQMWQCHLVFHIAQVLFVWAAVNLAVFGVITCVIQFLFAVLVLLEIVDFNLQQEAVCVSIEKLTLVTVLAFELVVAKIVHQYFSVVENRHRGINRLVQFRTLLVYFETSKIVRKQCATGKQRTSNQLANLFPFVTANYLMLTRSCMFSIVFPNTELFMSLQKFLSNSFLACFQNSVFIFLVLWQLNNNL